MPDEKYQPEVPTLLSGAPGAEELRQREIDKDRRDEGRFRRNQRFTNLFLACAAIATGLIGVWQGSLTRRAIDVANRQAKAAEDANHLTEEAAKKAEATSKDLAKETKDNLSLLQRQADAAEQNARIQQEGLQVENRPWLLCIKCVPSQEIPNQPWVNVTLKNFGKTPAFHLKYRTFLQWGRFLAKKTANYYVSLSKYYGIFKLLGSTQPEFNLDNDRAATVVPGDTSSFQLTIGGRIFEEKLEQKFDVRMLGLAEYSDFRGKPYVTHLCFAWVPAFPSDGPTSINRLKGYLVPCNDRE